MNYHESLGFLSTLIDYERWSHRDYEFKLDNFRAFLKKIGNPQEKLNRVVLVAGTKGKGSTATMLSNLLVAHNEKVGLYTSPHLEDYCERIRINGQSISEKQFASLVERLRPAILGHEPRITFFEALTTLAFLHFYEQKTTINVLEVGLGGRLDATNVTNPQLSVITKIGYDHTHMLGRTLGEIAREKCGILRKGTPAVIASQRPSALKMISHELRLHSSPPLFYGKDFSAELLSDDSEDLKFRYHGLTLKGEFTLHVLGQHQIENASIALAAAELLLGEIKGKEVRHTFNNFSMPARIEIIRKSPIVILDMCHNPESAKALREELDKHFNQCKKKVLLIGITKEKAVSQILRELAPFFTEIYVTSAKLPRAESKEILLDTCKKNHEKCFMIESTEEGILRILPSLDLNDLLVVAGSVYIAGEALKVLKPGKRP